MSAPSASPPTRAGVAAAFGRTIPDVIAPELKMKISASLCRLMGSMFGP
jgi:hypothetical protein